MIVVILLILIIVGIIVWAVMDPCTMCKDMDSSNKPWYSFLCLTPAQPLQPTATE